MCTHNGKLSSPSLRAPLSGAKQSLLLAVGLLLLATVPAFSMTTVELPVPSDPTVSFRIMFPVGSQNDPAGKEGIASLTASIMSDGGTKQNTYDQILLKLYPMAAGYGVSVDKEMTVFSGRVHKDHLNAYVDLLTQSIVSPAFAEADFERVKTNTLNYLDRTLKYSNDEAFGKTMLYDEIFAGTPYGHPEAGLPASVRSITLDDVKAFYAANFTAANVVIGVGGGYDAALVEKLKTALGALPASAPPPVAKSTPKMPDGLEVVMVDKETQSTAISMGFPLDVLRGSRDWYALWIANSWFGEHRNSSSHLYQVIREARGLNYGDYSYIEYFQNGWWHSFPPPNTPRRQQLFEIWIRPVTNDAAHFALRAAIRELQMLIDNGMTQEDFDLTKKFLKKYVRHYAPTTDWRLGYKLDDSFYGIQDHLVTAEKMADEISLAEVNAALKKHLQTQNMQIAIITKDAAALKDALVTNAVSTVTYATPKPELADEDKIISTYPLAIDAAKVTIIPVDSTFIQ